MAKPTYSIAGLDFETVTKINALLGGASVGTAGATGLPLAPVQTGAGTPANPVAPPPPPPPAPPVAPPPPPPPAPPAPPVVAPIVTPPATGGVTQEELIAIMSQKIGLANGGPRVQAILAQYNAKAPGTPGPVTNVDPAQYGNLKAALEALV